MTLHDIADILPTSTHGTPGRIMLLMIVSALAGSIGLMSLASRLSGSPHADTSPVIIASTEPGVTITSIRDDGFEVGSAILRDAGKAAVAKRAGTIPDGSDIIVIGYADERGPSSLNDRLADERAKSVGTALAANARPASRIIAAGARTAARCSTKPAADRDACWAHDRRVEIWVRAKPSTG